MYLHRVLIALVICVAAALACVGADPTPPNVLFFITDDESAVERSAYGWSTLPTPAFDRVAKDGVLFTNGFTTAPSCAPSRASVLTGRHFWELEQGGFIQAFLPKKYPTVSQVLADHGYDVAYTGKGWGPGSHPTLGIPSESLGRKFGRATIADPPKGVHDNDYAGNFAKFLTTRDTSKPFFFWAGVMEPHDPSGPDNHLLLEKEFGVTLDEVSLPPFVENTPRKRQARANFLYEICLADRHLARMLASLAEGGLLENTLVVVTSDNGTAISDGSQEARGKASPYDLGCHVPLAMMWPARVPAGRTVTDFVSFADFAPTFLAAAGLEVPSGMTGRSLLPTLTSGKSSRVEPERDFMITGLEWHGEFDPQSRSCRSIRDDRYAYLVRYANVDKQGQPLDTAALVKPVKEEFYDLKKDPWQLHDLATDPAMAGERERLATKLRQVGTDRGDPRFTAEMDLFVKTRAYVQKRKRMGYTESAGLPFEE
ncbi:MAG: sulfatase [Pirellulales bacterium]